MNITEEIVERWTKAGLLSQFTGSNKEETAEALQTLAEYLIARSYDKDGEFPSDFYSIIITEAAMVAAVMLFTNRKLSDLSDPEWFFNDFLSFVEKKHPKIDTEYTPFEYGWFQVERRICEEYAQQFTPKNNNTYGKSTNKRRSKEQSLRADQKAR